ncbi:type II toxin-antitoxin system RelE family toxin [Desulfatirhabdium butyrativorans]|uniref:type II toxin-antitoxin system RelE family toxin n=1 Tax=Desulfatirhabdium butyrativorans TaxID=340467 RepID=UPI0004802F0A|nr:type II toxin-antitoxin system RelE/ParE family toxin [Desulfatirhabdium butyrativorans]
MDLLYAKSFSKDLDSIPKESRIKKALLKVIRAIQEADSVSELTDVKKIKGDEGYYRIRIGEYRLGIKTVKNTVVLIRFIHRRDISRRFP